MAHLPDRIPNYVAAERHYLTPAEAPDTKKVLVCSPEDQAPTATPAVAVQRHALVTSSGDTPALTSQSTMTMAVLRDCREEHER